MIADAPTPGTKRLDEYASSGDLAAMAEALRSDAGGVAARLRGRTVWMLNSTSRGGGVAEMLPSVVDLLRELEVDARWITMEVTEPAFFELTKRIHNLLHDAGRGGLGPDERSLYERVSREVAGRLADRVDVDDLLVVHDPQPLAVGAMVKAATGIPAVWRCHIGLDTPSRRVNEAWRFLEPYAREYDHAVFTAPEYAPDFLADAHTIIHPALDPLSEKNRDLRVSDVEEILQRAGLDGAFAGNGKGLRMPAPDGNGASPYRAPVLRLRADDTFGPLESPGELGLLRDPVVTQISRWDRLKGFVPLMRGFLVMKRGAATGLNPATGRRLTPPERAILEDVRLVLAGPDPRSVTDDPEGMAELRRIRDAYTDLDADERRQIAVLSLPMVSRTENALIVNALQRSSTVVVQNSLQEGFGLTVTEAMWKGLPVVASRACGPRQQIRSGIDGLLVSDPTDPGRVARALAGTLTDEAGREALGRRARERVRERFLIFTQIRRWLEILDRVA